MSSTRIVPVLVAACLITSTSCSDSTGPTASSRSIPSSPTPPPSFVTLSGIIHLGFTEISEFTLQTADGNTLSLVGTETANLAGLDGAEVDVSGTWDGDAFAVNNFLVRRVGGIEVLDGTVTMQVDDETGDVHYGISLTRGSYVPLIDPPDELIAHLGQRVWVTDPADGQPLAFGIIGQPTQ